MADNHPFSHGASKTKTKYKTFGFGSLGKLKNGGTRSNFEQNESPPEYRKQTGKKNFGPSGLVMFDVFLIKGCPFFSKGGIRC